MWLEVSILNVTEMKGKVVQEHFRPGSAEIGFFRFAAKIVTNITDGGWEKNLVELKIYGIP